MVHGSPEGPRKSNSLLAISGLLLRQSELSRVSASRANGPRGNRTHYLSIKSRALILDRASGPAILPKVVPARFELASRANLALTGYKPAALPLSYGTVIQRTTDGSGGTRTHILRFKGPGLSQIELRTRRDAFQQLTFEPSNLLTF